jgi:hypothetical protein
LNEDVVAHLPSAFISAHIMGIHHGRSRPKSDQDNPGSGDAKCCIMLLADLERFQFQKRSTAERRAM